MLPSVRAAGIAIGLVLLAMPALAGPASAHALPQSSVPAAGSSVAVAPASVTITFGETPDPKLSTIKVLDATGASVTTGPAVVVADQPKQLTVPLKPVAAGVYTVAWRTVSAVDGHLATGSFAFAVGGAALPSASPGQAVGSTTSSSGPSIVDVAGRWLLFLGLILLVGGAFVGSMVIRPARTVARILLPIAWLTAAAGTTIVMASQLSDAGVAAGEVFDSSFGAVIVWRVAPLILVLPAVALAVRRGGIDRPVLLVVWVGAALALFADVSASHAATGSLAVLDVPIQFAHVLAVGVWLGGLAGLLLSLHGEPSEGSARAARRFSYAATAGIVTVGISGLLRAISEVGSVNALVETDFGRLVIAKSVLFGGLAGLGAMNHFRNVPAAGRSLRGLRRVGSVELLVAATVLLLTATLVNIAPPSEVAASNAAANPTPGPTAAPVVVTGNDFGTSVKVRLEVTQSSIGFDAFLVTVTDFDTGAAVDASGVTLRFVLPDRTDIGVSRLDLDQTGDPGVFRGSGGNLSIAGKWDVTATVVNGVSSVEVPLVVTTASSLPTPAPTPGPTIDVNAVEGLPTIYTVHLSAGRTVQVYADPGKAGANELHATFFDAAGTEMPIDTIVLGLKDAAGTAIALTPRMLEPGHFVADTTLVAGTFTLTISAPAPGGDQLTTTLDLPITK